MATKDFRKFYSQSDSRLVIYDHRGFNRVATGIKLGLFVVIVLQYHKMASEGFELELLEQKVTTPTSTWTTKDPNSKCYECYRYLRPRFSECLIGRRQQPKLYKLCSI